MAIQEALEPAGNTFDYALDATGDIKLVQDSEEIALLIRQRLQFIRGEWIFDTSRGVPLGEVFNRNTLKANIDSIIKRKILETQGVTSLVSYTSEYSFTTRTFSVQFRYTDRFSDEASSLSLTIP